MAQGDRPGNRRNNTETITSADAIEVVSIADIEARADEILGDNMQLSTLEYSAAQTMAFKAQIIAYQLALGFEPTATIDDEFREFLTDFVSLDDQVPIQFNRTNPNFAPLAQAQAQALLDMRDDEIQANPLAIDALSDLQAAFGFSDTSGTRNDETRNVLEKLANGDTESLTHLQEKLLIIQSDIIRIGAQDLLNSSADRIQRVQKHLYEHSLERLVGLPTTGDFDRSLAEAVINQSVAIQSAIADEAPNIATLFFNDAKNLTELQDHFKAQAAEVIPAGISEQDQIPLLEQVVLARTELLSQIPGNTLLLNVATNGTSEEQRNNAFALLKSNTEAFLSSQGQGNVADDNATLAMSIVSALPAVPKNLNEPLAQYTIMTIALSGSSLEQQELITNTGLDMRNQAISAFLIANLASINSVLEPNITAPISASAQTPYDPKFISAITAANKIFENDIEIHVNKLAEITGLPAIAFQMDNIAQWNEDDAFVLNTLITHRDQLAADIPNIDFLIEFGQLRSAMIGDNAELNLRADIYNLHGQSIDLPATSFIGTDDHKLYNFKLKVAEHSREGTLHSPSTEIFNITPSKVFNADTPGLVNTFGDMLAKIQFDMHTAHPDWKVGEDRLGALGTNTVAKLNDYLKEMESAEGNSAEKQRALAFGELYTLYNALPAPMQNALSLEMAKASDQAPNVASAMNDNEASIVAARNVLYAAAESYEGIPGLKITRETIDKLGSPKNIDAVTAAHLDEGFSRAAHAFFDNNFDLFFKTNPETGELEPTSLAIHDISANDDGGRYRFRLKPDGSWAQSYVTPSGIEKNTDPTTGEPLTLDGKHPDFDLFHTTSRQTVELWEEITTQRTLAVLDAAHFEIDGFEIGENGKYPAEQPSVAALQNALDETEQKLAKRLEENYDFTAIEGFGDIDSLIGDLKGMSAAEVQAIMEKAKALPGSGDDSVKSEIMTMVYQLQAIGGQGGLLQLAAMRDHAAYMVFGDLPGMQGIGAPDVDRPWKQDWGTSYDTNGNFLWSSMTKFRAFNLGGENGEEAGAVIHDYLAYDDSVPVSAFDSNEFAKTFIGNTFGGKTELTHSEVGLVAEAIMIKQAVDRWNEYHPDSVITNINSEAAKAAFMDDLRKGFYNWDDVQLAMRSADIRDPGGFATVKAMPGYSPIENWRQDEIYNAGQYSRFRGNEFNERFGALTEIGSSGLTATTTLNVNEAMDYFWRVPHYSAQFGEDRDQYDVSFEEMYAKHGNAFAQQIKEIMETISWTEMHMLPGQGEGDFQAAYIRRYQAMYEEQERYAFNQENKVVDPSPEPVDIVAGAGIVENSATPKNEVIIPDGTGATYAAFADNADDIAAPPEELSGLIAQIPSPIDPALTNPNV